MRVTKWQLAVLVFTFAVSYAVARTTGVLYGDALVIETTRGTQVASISSAGALVAASIDTGNGAAELYLMNQNVRTTDSPTFASPTASGYVYAHDISVTSNINAGGYIQFHPISLQEIVQMTPTVKGLGYFCSDCTPPLPIWTVVGGFINAAGKFVP